MELKWYAACTYPRHEKKILEQLENREIESFLPLYQTTHRWRNGVRAKLELPLFPGYIFVRMRLTEKLGVLQVPGIARLVQFGGVPAALPTTEIERLRAGLSQVAAEPHPFVRVGDSVRIRSGPLAGFEGILLRKKTEDRFILCMDLIMRAMSVEVDVSDLEPLPGNGTFSANAQSMFSQSVSAV